MINDFITGLFVFASLFGFGQQSFGAFSDPFLSIQLAASPTNGDCLTTDGTNNDWTTCAAGGGGSDSNWSFFNNSGIRLATTTNQVLIGGSATSTLDLLQVYGAVRATYFTATSTTASSTFPNLLSTNSTTTNATSTSLYNSGQTRLGALSSSLVLSGSTGILSNYAGTSCTNQFPRSLNAAGAATCASIALASDVSGDLPFSSLTQIAANSVLGNITGATADVAAIATSSLYSGTDGQVLARFNGTWVGQATTTLSTITGTLGVSKGGTGLTTIGGTNHILYTTAADTISSEAAFTYNPSSDLFTAASSSITNATSTSLFSTTASSTNLFASALQIANQALTITSARVATLLGSWDFGGADSIEIVNGTAPVVNAIGETALDTSANQLLIATSTNASYPAVFPLEQPLFSITIGSTTPEFISSGTIPISRWVGKGREVTRVECYVTGGTSKVMNISDGTNDTETTTCATTNTQDNSLDTNATFTASELWYIEFGATTGTVNYVTYTAYGYINRE